MSFASDVRGELARVPVSDACCARSELTSALLCAGGIAWRGRGRYAVTITAAEASTVRRYFGLLKQFMGIVGQIRTLTGDALNNQVRYQLAVPEEEAPGLLNDLNLLEEGALFGLRPVPPEETVRFSCCRKATSCPMERSRSRCSLAPCQAPVISNFMCCTAPVPQCLRG